MEVCLTAELQACILRQQLDVSAICPKPWFSASVVFHFALGTLRGPCEVERAEPTPFEDGLERELVWRCAQQDQDKLSRSLPQIACLSTAVHHAGLHTAGPTQFQDCLGRELV